MKKRKTRALGITARQGPRVGHPFVPWDISEEIADAFLSRFSDNCIDNRIKPPSFDAPIVGGRTTIIDSATGQPVPLTVVMAPSSEAFEDIKLPITGRYSPDRALIEISPTIGACKPPESWRNLLISAIRHELAHAADPYFYRTFKNVRRWEAAGASDQASILKRLPKPARDIAKRAIAARKEQVPYRSFCQYVQQKAEQNAFLTQVATEIELLSPKARSKKIKYRNPIDALENLSPTYREISGCLVPKMRRRFVKMAANLWSSGIIPR